MSAAPAAKPDDTGEAEGWALLEALKRRLDDQVTQTRKTQAQVTQLAESIAALVEVQRKRSRWLNINSFVAYLVFTVLCGVAFYFLYQSRAGELVTARDRAIGERDAADKRASEALAKVAARDDAAAHAAELARAKEAQTAQGEAMWKAAQAAFRAGKFADAAGPLEQALAKEPTGPRAPEEHYLAGLARSRLGELDPAIAHLSAACAADVGEEDARYQLALVEDRAGRAAKARDDYDKFAASHPQSPFTPSARARSAVLAAAGAGPSSVGAPALAPPAPGQNPAKPAPAPTPSSPPFASP